MAFSRAVSETLAESKLRAGRLIAIAYACALVVAIIVGVWLNDRHVLVMIAGADVAATLCIFAFSRVYKNSSFYDAYWSVAPMLIALTLCTVDGHASILRRFFVGSLVFAWGARLTYNWWRQWEGLEHEDFRYVELRAKTGPLFPLVDLFGIHLFPTLQVYLGCLALYPALTSTRDFRLLDLVATGLTATAIWIEASADRTLSEFRANRQQGEILEDGLWAYSRHPNYLGEIGFWWGLWLFALSADASFFWTGIGALAITLMFVFVSIPMMDARHVARRPAYAEHMKRVSALVPRLPKRDDRSA